jgi:hypothetical protein
MVSSQVLLPEITNTDVSVVENSSTDIPLLTIAHGKTDKSIQYKGFIKTPSAVASGDGNTLTSSSCEGMLGSEFVIIDDFIKIFSI